MSLERELLTPMVPASELDKAAILAQLERLTANPYFHHSKRYPSFLKFVFQETLEGRGENLKERTLGMEVFGRSPDYDTTNDPIVRVTAAEIRKRIAQYYQEPGHADEIRVSLPSGSYIPHFQRPSETAPPFREADEAVTPPAESAAAAPSRASLSRRLWTAMAAVVLLGIMAGAWQWMRRSSIDEFWQPFTHSGSPVLFCIADQSYFSTITLRDAGDPQRQKVLNDRMVTVIIDDISPLVDIAGMLQARGKSYTVKGESQTTLTDLRQGPSVFIGAFDNSWTLRATAPLRFHFANNADMSEFWIEDRNNPTGKQYLLDRTVQQGTGTYKDFAIVARMQDPNTDRPVVIAAGLARGGTVAAGEFLVNADHLRELDNVAPKDWQKKNIEVVLETQVIDGRSGPPRIVATHVW